MRAVLLMRKIRISIEMMLLTVIYINILKNDVDKASKIEFN